MQSDRGQVSSWCMISALNTSWRTSGLCPRFILASDCVRPPVPMLWFLPHAGLHLATEHSRSQELERGTRYHPVSPPHHLFPHSGDSWRHFFSSDNGVNNTNYCVVVLKCLALSTTLILANWTESAVRQPDLARADGSATYREIREIILLLFGVFFSLASRLFGSAGISHGQRSFSHQNLLLWQRRLYWLCRVCQPQQQQQ